MALGLAVPHQGAGPPAGRDVPTDAANPGDHRPARAVAEELQAISPAPELTQHHALTLLKTAARLEAMTMRLVVTQAWKLR